MLELINSLSGSGVAVVLISHNIKQVLDVFHEVLVLRHGHSVGNFSIDEVAVRDLVSLMTSGVT